MIHSCLYVNSQNFKNIKENLYFRQSLLIDCIFDLMTLVGGFDFNDLKVLICYLIKAAIQWMLLLLMLWTYYLIIDNELFLLHRHVEVIFVVNKLVNYSYCRK